MSDSPLAPNEAALFSQLGALGDDVAPDAHACRLRITLTTLGAGSSMDTRELWDVGVEAAGYFRKRHDVAAACRLSEAEEAQVLSLCESELSASRELVNRRRLLQV